MNYVKLSKQISYMLRHHPEEFGLILDSNGWCQIDEILKVLRCNNQWSGITIQTLEDMINKFNKKRFEIRDNKIRAYYGHSMKIKIVKEECEPPAFLYHGTSKEFITSIKKQGLLPMSRQYVHLSDNEDLAYLVGKRRDNTPIIIRIQAKKAWLNNIKFYHGNEDTWLSQPIPAEFLEIEYHN